MPDKFKIQSPQITSLSQIYSIYFFAKNMLIFNIFLHFISDFEKLRLSENDISFKKGNLNSKNDSWTPNYARLNFPIWLIQLCPELLA